MRINQSNEPFNEKMDENVPTYSWTFANAQALPLPASSSASVTTAKSTKSTARLLLNYSKLRAQSRNSLSNLNQKPLSSVSDDLALTASSVSTTISDDCTEFTLPLNGPRTVPRLSIVYPDGAASRIQRRKDRDLKTETTSRIVDSDEPSPTPYRLTPISLSTLPQRPAPCWWSKRRAAIAGIPTCPRSIPAPVTQRAGKPVDAFLKAAPWFASQGTHDLDAITPSYLERATSQHAHMYPVHAAARAHSAARQRQLGIRLLILAALLTALGGGLTAAVTRLYFDDYYRNLMADGNDAVNNSTVANTSITSNVISTVTLQPTTTSNIQTITRTFDSGRFATTTVLLVSATTVIVTRTERTAATLTITR